MKRSSSNNAFGRYFLHDVAQLKETEHHVVVPGGIYDWGFDFSGVLHMAAFTGNTDHRRG
jgi:hypothetical protein